MSVRDNNLAKIKRSITRDVTEHPRDLSAESATRESRQRLAPRKHASAERRDDEADERKQG